MRVLDNIVIYDYYKSLLPNPNKNVERIVSKTSNTWQPNRSKIEKLKNTLQGKYAEKVVCDYITSETDYTYLSYDEFRNNQYDKHAPFDGLLFHKNIFKKTLNNIIHIINFEVSNNDYGVISPKAREDARKNGIYLIEVKSTKINEKKRDISERIGKTDNFERQLIREIKKDDYLTYPNAIRHSGIRNTAEYLSVLRNKGLIKSSGNDQAAYDEMLNYEMPHMCDLYFRVYLDMVTNKAYLMGFITRNDFFSISPPVIKKMVQFGKSEGAIYLALPISRGRNLADLRPTIDIYAKIYG